MKKNTSVLSSLDMAAVLCMPHGAIVYNIELLLKHNADPNDYRRKFYLDEGRSCTEYHITRKGCEMLSFNFAPREKMILAKLWDRIEIGAKEKKRELFSAPSSTHPELNIIYTYTSTN